MFIKYPNGEKRSDLPASRRRRLIVLIGHIQGVLLYVSFVSFTNGLVNWPLITNAHTLVRRGRSRGSSKREKVLLL